MDYEEAFKFFVGICIMIMVSLFIDCIRIVICRRIKHRIKKMK